MVKPKNFSFPSRRNKESPDDYWTRVIKENLKTGINPETVAEIIGKILGSKEEREGIDELTGLKTKRVFWEDLKESLGLVSRYSQGNISLDKISLILLDLDDFKKLNDEKGYLEGDKLLRKVSQILQRRKRATDIVVRWGGEEFCLILIACPLKMAVKIAEGLRKEIEKIEITASFGVVGLLEETGQETPEELFNRANVACALAKGTIKHALVKGPAKNRVVCWQPGMPRNLKEKNG